MKKGLLCIVFCLFVFSISADEGMWMLNLLKQQKYSDMKKLGLKLKDYDIYNPNRNSLKDAVVQFGNGCTGEVVSSEGLVLTNHHCGYGAIQSHSTLEHNYLDDGFWAMNRSQELPNPGLTITFIENIEDVTTYVKSCLDRDKSNDKDGVFYLSPSYLNGLAREKVGEDVLVKTPGVVVEIKPFYDGNQYYMFTKKIYSDIRLVGAPPSSIGKFGADTDNWMWPRHTGDFSVFRIYADKDGNPATYSPSNVPLKPKKWLKISTKGVQANDFAMILGFPGTTNKYYTSWEVAERRDIDNTVRIEMREIRQEAMLEEMLKDPAVKIQYASKYSGSTNSYKNAIGTNWAIGLRDFEQLKLDQQNRLLDWAKNKNQPKYKEALDNIERLVNERSKLRYQNWMLNEGILRGIEFAQVPMNGRNMLVSTLENGAKDEEIEKGLAQLELDYRKFANENYNPLVDRIVSSKMLEAYIQKVARDSQPKYFDIIYSQFDGDPTAFVSYIFDESIFDSETNLKSFMNDSEKLKRLKEDPMFNFAQSVMSESRTLSMQLSQFDIPFAKNRQTYLEGILAMDGTASNFPDANLTLRLSYGVINGYQPKDAVVYSYQSTMDGIIEKEDSTNWEFIVPGRLKELYETKDFGKYGLTNGKMPVAFTATTHTTGGNSGSPVMNGKGELIGINFDRNWEGVGGDIQYLPDYQRSIIVDIRYVLFIIDKYAGATHLINEMDLE